MYSSGSSPKPVPLGLPVDGLMTGGFTTLVVEPEGRFVPPAAGRVVPPEGRAVSAGGFAAPPGGFGLSATTGLPVILSMISFVPAPSAAPVSAFTTWLAAELGLLMLGLTVGLAAVFGLVVLVVGVVDVLFVTVGFVVGVVVDVSVDLGTSEVLGVEDVLVVRDVLGAKDVLGVEDVFVVSVGLVTDEEEPRPVREGLSFTPRMTLSNGARSRPLASGSCLLDVRFFRIAIFYPVFLTNDVRPAMLVTGLSFAVLANVFGGAVGAAF